MFRYICLMLAAFVLLNPGAEGTSVKAIQAVRDDETATLFQTAVRHQNVEASHEQEAKEIGPYHFGGASGLEENDLDAQQDMEFTSRHAQLEKTNVQMKLALQEIFDILDDLHQTDQHTSTAQVLKDCSAAECTANNKYLNTVFPPPPTGGNDARLLEAYNHFKTSNRLTFVGHDGALCLWIRKLDWNFEQGSPACVAPKSLLEEATVGVFSLRTWVIDNLMIPKEIGTQNWMSSYFSNVKEKVARFKNNRPSWVSRIWSQDGWVKMTDKVSKIPFESIFRSVAAVTLMSVSLACPPVAGAMAFIGLAMAIQHAAVDLANANSMCQAGGIFLRTMVFDGAAFLVGFPVENAFETAWEGTKLVSTEVNQIVDWFPGMSPHTAGMGAGVTVLDEFDGWMSEMSTNYARVKNNVKNVLSFFKCTSGKVEVSDKVEAPGNTGAIPVSDLQGAWQSYDGVEVLAPVVVPP